MATDHKQTSKDLLGLWGDNTPHRPSDYLAPQYRNHQLPDPAHGTSTKSLQEYKTLLDDFHNGFSDVKMEILQQFAEGNYVCSRWQMTAKHTGKFMEYPATGKTTTWGGAHIDRYEGDQVVESWVEWDKYSFLEGLGLVK